MSRPAVLVVEDDEWLAQQHVRTLKAAEFDAAYVLDGIAAMELIDQAPPDVILLDILLSGPNGLTLLHELRSHADLAAIPVVLCTNSAEMLTGKDMSAYGVRTVLDKTKVTPVDLVAAIRKVLL